MLRLLVVLAVPLLGACSSTIDRSAMHKQLVEGKRLFATQTLAEAEGTQPQLSVPFRVAVAPPMWRANPRWTEKERAIIESWGADAKATDLVSSLEMIPAVSVELSKGGNGDDWLDAVRVAAARQHADAVLLIRDVEDSSEWLNVLSILDLTIVGAFVFPGHKTEAVSMMDALLLDNRNLYLYATAEAEGHAEDTTTYAKLDSDGLIEEARRKALQRLGQELLAKARTIAATPGAR